MYLVLFLIVSNPSYYGLRYTEEGQQGTKLEDIRIF
jgi:hypothetical protein